MIVITYIINTKIMIHDNKVTLVACRCSTSIENKSRWLGEYSYASIMLGLGEVDIRHQMATGC
jgi:hypothetical protein